MIRIIIAAFIISSMISCKPKTEAVAKIHDEVMAVHDEVMPKMGEIHKIKKQLKSQLSEQIKQADSTRSQLLQAILELEKADDGMMQWMSDFKSSFRGTTEEETIAYLEDEKNKITTVSMAMKAAIENGRNLIQK